MEQWLDLIAKTGGVAMFLIAVGYGVMRVVDRDAGYKDVIRLYERDNVRLRAEVERGETYRANNEILRGKLEALGVKVDEIVEPEVEIVEPTTDYSADNPGN